MCELKLCMECGSEAFICEDAFEEDDFGEYIEDYCVMCEKCDAETGWYRDWEDAAKAWNKMN